MMSGLKWLVYIVVATTAFYFVGLNAIPYGVMQIFKSRMASQANVNAIFHSERATHTARTVVRPSPDLLYSVCWYDLSKGPVRVVSGAPRDTYWSVAFYRSNTDNFFALNDSQTQSQKADIVLYADGTAEPTLAPGQTAVKSPSNSGVILIRTLVSDEALLPEVDAERRQATCAPFTP